MRMQWIAIAALAAVVLYIIVVFNLLVRLRNQVREGWSGIVFNLLVRLRNQVREGWSGIDVQFAISLARVHFPSSSEGLPQIVLIHREELDGFFAGLYGNPHGKPLPDRTQRALEVLADIRGMLAGIYELVSNPQKSAPGDDVAALLKQVHELSKIAKIEIHAAVLACAWTRCDAIRRAASVAAGADPKDPETCRAKGRA